MLCFLAGFIIPLLGLLAWAITHDVTGIWWEAKPDPLHAVALLIGLPLVTSWLSLELVARVRPRRAFDGRSKSNFRRLICGLSASLVTILFTTLTLVLLETEVPDEVVITGSTALATIGCALLLKRKKKGHCIRCGYDLRDSQHSAICPECGSRATAG